MSQTCIRYFSSTCTFSPTVSTEGGFIKENSSFLIKPFCRYHTGINPIVLIETKCHYLCVYKTKCIIVI